MHWLYASHTWLHMLQYMIQHDHGMNIFVHMQLSSLIKEATLWSKQRWLQKAASGQSTQRNRSWGAILHGHTYSTSPEPGTTWSLSYLKTQVSYWMSFSSTRRQNRFAWKPCVDSKLKNFHLVKRWITCPVYQTLTAVVNGILGGWAMMTGHPMEQCSIPHPTLTPPECHPMYQPPSQRLSSAGLWAPRALIPVHPLSCPYLFT